MKKIIFLFLILFMSISIVKADSTFYLGDKVPNMYVESINGSDIHNGAPFIIHRSDGAIVYCINPFQMMSTTGIYKEYTQNDPIFNLTSEQLNKLNIISYYGYEYQNHTDIKWFGITQYMMWKSLGFTDVYFTDVYYGSRVEKYQSEVNELENLVNNYYTLPSFSNQHYEFQPNTSYELIDTNNILNNYEIIESNITSSINNNKLIINTNNSGNYKITFVRKSPINRDYILYNLEGAQSLLYPGKINEITFSISIEVNSGSITVNKYDSENKKRLEATLSGATYGIYKENNLVSSIVTNQFGSASIDNLPLGDYTIREITSPKGYNYDTNIYNITISKNNKDVVINSYSKVIEGRLIINKYYGSNNNYIIDDNAIFEVYNDNKLIKTINNKSIETFEYGTYLIKQISGKKYYDLVNDFYVSVTEEKDYKYDFYTDKTDEIKAYEELLNKREEAINKKEQELIKLKNEIEEKSKDLDNFKNEINEKQKELDKEKEELRLKEEGLVNLENEIKQEYINLEELKSEIENEKILLSIEKEELETQEKILMELKKQLDLKSQQFDDNKKVLEELEKNILIKEEQVNKTKEQLHLIEINLKAKEQNLMKLKEEIINREEDLSIKAKQLDLINSNLKEKEKTLLELEHSINNKEIEYKKTKEELEVFNKKLEEREKYITNKEIELKEKEQIINLKNKKEEVLVVEVPNTYKRNYNKLLSMVFIIIGSLLIIYGKKKITNH